MNPNLKALIDKHPTLSYKEVLFEDTQLMIVFFDIQKDDEGHEYFDEFFVTDPHGSPLDNLTDREFTALKKLV